MVVYERVGMCRLRRRVKPRIKLRMEKVITRNIFGKYYWRNPITGGYWRRRRLKSTGRDNI